MHYSRKTLSKYRDANSAYLARIKEKEFWETHDTVEKSLPYIRKKLEVRRIDTLLDLCSGCSLNGYYTVAKNYAKCCVCVDKKFPKSSYRLGGYYSRFAGRVSFREESIYDNKYDVTRNSVVMSIHPCRELAFRVLDIAFDNDASIVIVPCCIGKNRSTWIDNFCDVSRYTRWCMKIAEKIVDAGYDVTVRKVRESATPVGNILIGVKTVLKERKG